MGGFIIVNDRRDIRNEMHERMSGGRRDYRHMEGKEYDNGYREGYEHGYRDHERDMGMNEEREEYRNTRYGR